MTSDFSGMVVMSNVSQTFINFHQASWPQAGAPAVARFLCPPAPVQQEAKKVLWSIKSLL